MFSTFLFFIIIIIIVAFLTDFHFFLITLVQSNLDYPDSSGHQ